MYSIYCLGVSLVRDLRITDIKTYPLSAPRGVDISRPDHYLPYWRELAEAGVRRNFYSLLVEVIASDGSSGWGGYC